MPANKPFVLGLTGGIGCGKSAAAAYLTSMGAAHVDADAISRAMTAKNGPALAAIRNQFGDGVFCGENELDRGSLAKKVFADPEARRALEGILHPMIRKEMVERIRSAGQAGVEIVLLDVPLLFETGMELLCDEVWAMSVPEEVQIERVIARDGMPREDAMARINGQMKMSERNARADRVIDSNGTFEETQLKLTEQYNDLLRRTETRRRHG